MNKRPFMLRSILVLATCLALAVGNDVFAADKYRLSVRFFHLGELIASPMIELEEGQTAAGSYFPQGWGQYTVAALVRPAADGQVYVSMQFSSGKIDVQPNLLVDIGKPASATIDKIRLELLVEKIETPAFPLQSLTQNAREIRPQ